MRPVDALVNAVRRGLERLLPWYDPADQQRIRAETERVRRRSIAARIHAEDIAERYRKQDGVLRR